MGWKSSNEVTGGSKGQGVKKSNDKISGKSAVKILPLNAAFKPNGLTTGIALGTPTFDNTEFIMDFEHTGGIYNKIPIKKIIGYYKYQNGTLDRDSAYCTVLLKKLNSNTIEIVGNGSFIFSPTTNYTKFEVSVSNISGISEMDTLSVGFFYKTYNTTVNYTFESEPKHYLMIDSVQVFDIKNNIADLVYQQKSLTYPNPVNNKLYLKNVPLGAELLILTMNGQCILKTINTGTDLDINQIPAGQYILKVIGPNHTNTTAIIINH